MNKTALADYFTGLVILTHSIPETLTDANGDNLRDCFTQTLHDTADELGINSEVNWDCEGEPADVVAIDRPTIRAIDNLVGALDLAMERLPQIDGEAND